MRDTILYFVVPCYNEEEVLEETARQLYKKCKQLIKAEKISPESRILFVNDGSKDRTWELITNLHNWNPIFAGLSLSRNRGHQNALLAGLMTAREYCDITVSMDADLQDDLNAVDEMISKYEGGCNIVYGVRNDRSSDTRFKRGTAGGFYRMMRRMGVDIVDNHADFRLMDRKSLTALSQFKEVNLFLRGIVPMIGFKTDAVYYVRGKRQAGESKYPLRKMIGLAVDGITSFSIKPITFVFNTGIFLVIVSIIMAIVGIVQAVTGSQVANFAMWDSILVSIFLVGGLILIGLGIIGEYVGKAYMETKGRPRFLIDEFLNTGVQKKRD